MAGRANSKLKVLYLWKILKEKSDIDHPMNAQDICDELQKVGIESERKSIYTSLKVLEDFGMDVEKAEPASRGWYLEDRLFEEQELLLLIDAFQSTSVMSNHLKRDLLDRILKTSLSEAERRSFDERYSYLNTDEDDGSTGRDSGFYNIAVFMQAIADDRKVQVQYQKANADKASPLVVSPYALIWSDNNYYLVCNKSSHPNFMHLRLDRVQSATETAEERIPCSSFAPEFQNGFDANRYKAAMFNDFSGELHPVTLRCAGRLFSQMKDRFGERAIRWEDPKTKEYFRVKADVFTSAGFERWVFQFGSEMEVLEPADVRADIVRRARDTLALYEGEEQS
ncbi:MAG: WYL domain-containing protein [Oscillospiraceae bacterium]|nr:WYL domain-containing protein [Oscillospiraceae bacterium]